MIFNCDLTHLPLLFLSLSLRRPCRRRAAHNRKRINRMRKRRNAAAANGPWVASLSSPSLRVLCTTTRRWMAKESLRNQPRVKRWRMLAYCRMCSVAGMWQWVPVPGATSGQRSMSRPMLSQRSRLAWMCGKWRVMLPAMPTRMDFNIGAPSGQRWPSLWVFIIVVIIIIINLSLLPRLFLCAWHHFITVSDLDFGKLRSNWVRLC